jgi:general secretion pathway protein A
MYAKFYGLQALPFQLTPDAQFFFDSTEHRRAMAHLTYGLHHAEGFIIITGEVGAGKTMLVDHLLAQIDRESFVAAKIVTSQLGGDDMLRMVAAGFGIAHENQPKATLLTRIQEFVLGQVDRQRRALLIIDEAQNLSFQALEELRMLSNIVVDSRTALQSFLLGQPQFRDILADRQLDQLRQRVTAAYHLGPLNEDDSKAYVMHRLRCAGWTDDPHFAADCFAPIYRHTGGVPRRINTLCSRLLLYGFLEESHTISGGDVDQVAADLGAEIAAITRPSGTGGPNGGGAIEGQASLSDRVAGLEGAVAKHDRTLRRVIELTASYLKSVAS